MLSRDCTLNFEVGCMLGKDRTLNFEFGSLPGGLGCAGPSLVMLGGGSKCSPRGTGFTGTTSEFPLLPPLWSPSGNSEYFVNEAHVFILHWPLQITSNPHILLPLSSPPGPGNTRAASFFPGGPGSFPSSGPGLCLLRGTPHTPPACAFSTTACPRPRYTPGPAEFRRRLVPSEHSMHTR